MTESEQAPEITDLEVVMTSKLMLNEATVVCGSCGEVLLRSPITVPSALLDRLKPCGEDEDDA